MPLGEFVILDHLPVEVDAKAGLIGNSHDPVRDRQAIEDRQYQEVLTAFYRRPKVF